MMLPDGACGVRRARCSVPAIHASAHVSWQQAIDEKSFVDEALIRQLIGSAMGSAMSCFQAMTQVIPVRHVPVLH